MSKLTANNQYKILFNNVLEELKIKCFLEYYLSIKHVKQIIN